MEERGVRAEKKKSKSKKKKQNRKKRQQAAAAEAEAREQEAAVAVEAMISAAAVPANPDNKNKLKKKNKKYEHQASINLIDHHRTFDTLVMLIKEDPPTRMRLSDLAERASGGRWVGDPITGRGEHNKVPEWQMGARGMLVAEMMDETGRPRSPAELALALEFWPHEKCTRDLPQYAKGRFDGRDGRPRGGPGKDFPYDPDFSTAVARHAFPFEILFCCFSIAGVRGALEDTTNMYSCASG